MRMVPLLARDNHQRPLRRYRCYRRLLRYLLHSSLRCVERSVCIAASAESPSAVFESAVVVTAQGQNGPWVILHTHGV